jgi:hypothetical protein
MHETSHQECCKFATSDVGFDHSELLQREAHNHKYATPELRTNTVEAPSKEKRHQKSSSYDGNIELF